MVRNLDELLVEATKRANDAKNELKKKIEEFIERMDTTEEELAHALGVSNAEIARILRGDGEATISTLSKILVATNNAVEIKPVSRTPIRSYGKRAVEDTPRHEHVRPVDTQPRDSHGRFARRVATTARRSEPDLFDETPSNPLFDDKDTGGFDEELFDTYNNLPDVVLKDMISRNLWTAEIDLARASHREMVLFMCKKETEMAEMMRRGTAPRPMPRPMDEDDFERTTMRETPPHHCGRREECCNDDEDKDVDEIIDKIEEFVRNNPRISDKLNKILGDL